MNNGAVQIEYDGDGNRVSKTVNGVTTKYLVDDLNPTGYPQVVEELIGGAVTRTYTYGLQRISQDQVISNTWTPSYYGYDRGPRGQVFVRGVGDGMGSVRQLTNTAGAITDQYEYDAFGNEFTISGGSGTPNEMLYRGEQYDSDLGLYYLRARYYNPLTGRFMSRDPYDPKLRGPNGIPIDPRALHKYLYANGDPVNGLDPTGRGDLVEYALSLGNRVQIYTQVYVPLYIGNLQFYGTIAAGLSTAVGWWCELTDSCGPQPVDPGPGPFEPEGPPPVEPGGAGAQH